MKCPSCNKDNDDNRKFCTYCGAKLPVIKYCPKCGAMLEQNQKFCIKCGTPNESFSLTKPSYPVFSQPIVTNPNNQIPEPHISEAKTNDSSVSQDLVSTPNLDNAEQETPNASLTETNQIDFNDSLDSSQEDLHLLENEESEAIPQYEDFDNTNSSTKWIIWIILLILFAGGVLIFGQYLNWWNIEMLSWAGGKTDKNITVPNSEYEEEVEIIEVEEEENNNEKIEVSEPFKITLHGTVGNKYPIEMILEGEKKGDVFYPANGKYRYTKYEGAWINLHCGILEIVNSKTYLKILEYTDGNLTGSWHVKFDPLDNTLNGEMTNSKGDTYSISLKSGSELKSGYNKIEGAVVADSNIYPFYIDFFVENESIKNASYHNPNHDVKTDLTKINISEDEYYFEGDLNGKALIIRFSKNNPHKGTLYDGSNTLDIEMNL